MPGSLASTLALVPVAASDLLIKYSLVTATAGNTTAGTASNSLGGFVSTTQIASGVEANYFPDVTGDENTNENVDYVCVFLHNSNSSSTLRGAVVWLASQVAGGSNLALAIDLIGPTPVASTTAQATTITGKNVMPVGVSSFSAPTSRGTGLALGDLPAGNVVAIWIQRTSTDSPALTGDGAVLQISGNTDAS